MIHGQKIIDKVLSFVIITIICFIQMAQEPVKTLCTKIIVLANIKGEIVHKKPYIYSGEPEFEIKAITVTL